MVTADPDTDKVYSGEEDNAAAKFFDFDMEFEAYCEAEFGDTGTGHWRGIAFLTVRRIQIYTCMAPRVVFYRLGGMYAYYYV